MYIYEYIYYIYSFFLDISKYIKYMKICARKRPEGSDKVKYGPKWSKTAHIHFL